ncbi:hypothetical protein FO440_12665 [Mucilaginibacter corticis]|uniref:Peptidase M56 domain-containing protein n=1 Tax=Mucilaginibacter corticis TaxID=2597670 RepID=A0A556MKZ3_9SPHI|nr:M56 family metallopeptidase [Mucilaginibacter corticis]TSJ40596.1 hypothetical protein FO440_12665 [Mucilaginibacter corticis]
MNLLYYLAEANIYLGVFYLAYCLLLNKETYYQLNRAYLLFSCTAAFVLPILQVGALKPVETAVDTTLNYTLPAYTEQLPVTNYVNVAPVMVEHHLAAQDYLVYVYLLGAVVLFAMLMIKLFGLARLMRNAQTSDALKYKVVYLPETGVAFSFFNYLFIGDNASAANTIIRHELVHIRQKHSVDIIFLEVLKVINWFNPFVYLLQNSLKTVHEYIADEQTAAFEDDALTYSTFLVNNAYGTDGPSFTHSFFNYNLLKKRIIMLNRERSGRAARLKYLVILPLFASLLCVSTLAFSKTYGWVDLDPAKPVKHESSRIIPTPQDFGKVKAPSVSGAKPKLIILDGKVIHPGPDETVSADSVTDVPENTAWAIKKWGAQAKNGVRIFSGHGAVIKKSESPLTPRNQFGGRMCGSSHNAQLPITQMLTTDPGLLFIVDGKKYAIDKSQLNDKTLISLTCDSMTVYDKGNAYAKSKWGNDVGQVVVLKGHASAKLFNWPDAKSQTSAGSQPITQPATANDVSQEFYTYLLRSIKYSANDLEKNISGRTITLFAVDNDHNLLYAQVVRSPSDAMSNEIIRSLKASPDLSSIKPGIQYVLSVSFTLGLVDPAPGEELAPGPITHGQVITYNPSGMDIPKNPPGTLVLNECVIRGYIKTPIRVVDTVAKPDWGKFYQYFGAHVLYPSADRKEHIAGRVITIFALDADHNLQYAKVVRTPSDAMANEVIRVLKKCTELSILKPGIQYTLPISYTLDNGNIGDPVTVTQDPKTHDPNSGIYNPNSIDIQNLGGGLGLNEVVIRGYTKQN